MAPPTAIDMIPISDPPNLSFSGRPSVNDILARRSKAPVMSGGVAANTSSDMFKDPACIHYPGKGSRKLMIDQSHEKPKAKRWDRTFVMKDG